MFRPRAGFGHREFAEWSGHTTDQSELDRQIARELLWRNRTEFEIRAEMDAALERWRAKREKRKKPRS